MNTNIYFFNQLEYIKRSITKVKHIVEVQIDIY